MPPPTDPPREYRQSRFAPPPGSTELILVRHGESAAAHPDRPFPLVDGHGDPELAPEGREQAERLAARLAREGVDAIYVTTLRRTRETAEPLARLLGLPLGVEPDLREVHLGEWEGGLYRQKVAELDPVAVQMFERERWDVIPGAEPNERLAARVGAAVRRLAARHPDQRVVAVSHGGAIAQLLSLATGARPFAFVGADNASITHLVVSEDRWIVRRFNDTAHLDSHLTLRTEPLT